MNKRLLIVLALLGCCWAGAWAEELSESQALSLARQFVAGSQVRKSVPNVTSAGQVSGLYAFNVSSSGFVIVSNDDQTVPILAYGQDGNIDTDELPDNMRAWLQGYADQIAWLRAQDQEGTQGPQKVRSAGMRRIDAESKKNIDLTLEGSALAGAEARTLSSASLTDGVLTLNFGDPVATLAAGVPYIIKWAKADGYDDADPATRDIISPVFEGVTIQSIFKDFISEDKKVQFLGRYSAYTYTRENKNTLLLGTGNTLYYPQPSVDAQTGAALRPTIGAFRAYFELDPSAAASVKAFSISFGDESPTGIGSVDGSGFMVNGSGAWYTLDGRRLNGKPSQRGIYVNQGRKVVIK